MKRAAALFALSLMWCSAAPSAAWGATLTGPIAPAARGQVQCYRPNVAAKTCLSIAAYTLDSAGVIQNTAFVLVNPDPLIIMTTTSPVRIDHGQVCGSISQDDLSAARFTVAGQEATPEQEARLRGLVIQAMSKFFGHDLCTAYVPDGGAFIAKATDNGVPQPQGEQKVIWISTTDGYHVRP